MFRVIPINGLCNRMRVIDSAVSLCRETGVGLRIYWVKDPLLNCAFTDLFEPIPDVEIKEKKMPFVFHPTYGPSQFNPNIYQKLHNWVILSVSNVKSLAENGYDFKLLTGRQVLLASYVRFYPTEKMFSIFVPRKSLQRRIDNESNSFNHNTIGLHIRRNDNKASIEHSPVELFIDAIETEIALNRDVTFYLSSDCTATKQQLYNRYGHKIITNFEKSDRNSKEGMQQALVELYALSHTRKIYGSYWSSFSDTAAAIGGIDGIVKGTEALFFSGLLRSSQ